MRLTFLVSVTILLSACDGGGSESPPPPPVAPAAPSVSTDVGIKEIIYSWPAVPGATHYKLLENADGHSGFTQVGPDISAGTLSVTRPVAVHLQDWLNALYIVQACNAAGCTGSVAASVATLADEAIGYFKASNPEQGLGNYNVEFPLGDGFGSVIALSADGRTLAVSAPAEDGGSSGVNGDQDDNSAWDAGAVYLFRLHSGSWTQQAYIKASNAEGGDRTDPEGRGDTFGWSIALSGDGNTLAVGTIFEDSSATGINGDQDDNTEINSGAVYVFRYDGTNWEQQAYIKASNTEGAPDPATPSDSGDAFGSSIALSADGNILAVKAPGEDSNATGVNGDEMDNSAPDSGAVYVFRFDGAEWSRQTYLKGTGTVSNAMPGSVTLSDDGNTMAVGGRMYNFDGMEWIEQNCVLYVEPGLCAGGVNQLSADGNTLLLDSRIFRFDGTTWSEQSIFTVNDPDESLRSIAMSSDGNMVAMGVRTTPQDTWWETTGAVHIFVFNGVDWPQEGNPVIPDPATQTADCDWAPWAKDSFGGPISLNSDGSFMAVGAIGEDSGSPGVGGDRNDGSQCESGAVYLY